MAHGFLNIRKKHDWFRDLNLPSLASVDAQTFLLIKVLTVLQYSQHAIGKFTTKEKNQNAGYWIENNIFKSKSWEKSKKNY